MTAKKARRSKKPPRTLPGQGMPPLPAEDRLSTYVDYREMVQGYEELVAAEGEARVKEGLDHLFYYLGTSYDLLDEPVFRSLNWHLDPHDYLVYELLQHIPSLEGRLKEALGTDLADAHAEHIVYDALSRYYTPAMRRDVARRARRLARRETGTALGMEAEAVGLAAEDPGIGAPAVGLLVESMRRTLLQAVLDLEEVTRREWEKRDRSLDRWLEAMLQADYERTAEEAVRRLQQAGRAALPFVEHVFFQVEQSYACDAYPLRAILQVAAAIPAPQSQWMLAQAVVDCRILGHWAAEQMAANMPMWACPYFHYLLTDPRPPDAYLAAAGLAAIVASRCADAFDLARLALRYRVEDAARTETVQVAAWQALLALGDPAAVPVLRAYLADEEASPAARNQLVEALRRGGGESWWREIIPQAAER